jgi:hypothetical protein
MDATRTRRVRDRARQAWYARHRQWRFARHLGFPSDVPVRSEPVGDGPGHSLRCSPIGSALLVHVLTTPGPDEKSDLMRGSTIHASSMTMRNEKAIQEVDRSEPRACQGGYYYRETGCTPPWLIHDQYGRAIFVRFPR